MASEFLLAYQELIRLADNNPVDLASRARTNEILQAACDRIAGAASSLHLVEKYSDRRYADNVPTVEIAARREYEKRWRLAVASTDQLWGFLCLPLADDGPTVDTDDPFQEKLNSAVDDAKSQASSFSEFIEYNRCRAENASDFEELPECVDEGLRVWEDLRIRTGFSIASMLARLELVPFVLVPSEVSKSHGTGEFISLYTRLHDAQQAFIFGCYLSSAALQRALLEDVLQRHYIQGKMALPARIKAAALPIGLNLTALHAINAAGNDVLHYDRSSSTNRRELLEILVNGLDALKILIEKAPIGRPATR